MRRIYPIVLEVLKQLQPSLRRIEVQDRDMGRQLRRASASNALKLGERWAVAARIGGRAITARSAQRARRSRASRLQRSSYVEEDKQLRHQLDRVVGTRVLPTRA